MPFVVLDLVLLVLDRVAYSVVVISFVVGWFVVDGLGTVGKIIKR
jgi:hypothetical protein